ncbi:ImmA/IrrE family metallo-endopeptidase [Neolewinella sp.]|uniref:ImmA/IrrE family metallo-endopeptidase n=1 Tax=Neolewinella sp. TaxID=2993543 RepID=UPI003B52FF93
MTVRVPIRSNILTWAIERAGYAVEPFLAGRPDAAKWMSGDKEPTLRQLEQFAKRLHVPFGYLLLEEPPEEPPVLPFFRTTGVDARIPPEVRDAINIVKQRQEWLSDYLKNHDHEPLPFVARTPESSSPIELAATMRELLGYATGAPIATGTAAATLRELAERLERIGVQVTFSGVVGNNNKRPIPVEACRGFVLLDAYAPFIFVNNQDAKAAQLFTLVHEFAHVLVGQEGIFDLADLLLASAPTERLCDAAAAEFLVPAKLLRDKF